MNRGIGLGLISVWLFLLCLGFIPAETTIIPVESLAPTANDPKRIPCPESGLVPVVHKRLRTRSEFPSVDNSTQISTGSGAVTVKATGYCSCAACCGTSDGVTASGTQAHWGTIAAPRGWVFGSRYTIVGLAGTFTVEDRGGSIKGSRIDIWFPTHAEALAWGVRTVTITRID